MGVLHAARGHGWQLILADLALILFLLTLAGLPVHEAQGSLGKPSHYPSPAAAPEDPVIASAQALYRPVAGGPGIAEWLAGQPNDPRATLTIFARYPAGQEQAAWDDARMLAADAAESGMVLRTIIGEGEEFDIYASLAYDSPVPEPEE
ncbi:MAG: hypothetical protein ACXIT4_04225 [Erythrobacter sp.]